MPIHILNRPVHAVLLKPARVTAHNRHPLRLRDLGLAQPVAVANDSMKLAFVVTISSSFMGWASHQKTSSFDPEHFKFSCSSWKR